MLLLYKMGKLLEVDTKYHKEGDTWWFPNGKYYLLLNNVDCLFIRHKRLWWYIPIEFILRYPNYYFNITTGDCNISIFDCNIGILPCVPHSHIKFYD